MTGLALYVAGGMLLIGCLLRVFFNGGTEDEFSNPLCRTRVPSLDSLSDTQFCAQLFGSEDWSYVVSIGSTSITREFLRTRKALAFAWVREARLEAAALINAHRAASRTSAHLDFFVELRVVLAYTSFIFFCMLLNLIIRIKGPVALHSLAKLADARSEQLYEIVGQGFPIAETLENEFSGLQTPGRGPH